MCTHICGTYVLYRIEYIWCSFLFCTFKYYIKNTNCCCCCCACECVYVCRCMCVSVCVCVCFNVSVCVILNELGRDREETESVSLASKLASWVECYRLSIISVIVDLSTSIAAVSVASVSHSKSALYSLQFIVCDQSILILIVLVIGIRHW